MMQDNVTATPVWLRILQFPVVRILVLGTVIFFMMTFNNGFMLKLKDTPQISIAVTIGMALAGLVIYTLWGRLVEGREVSELSLAGVGREWATGVLIGFGLISIAVLTLFILGMYQVDGFNPLAFMLPAISMAISSGTFEELFFRGIIYKSVEDLAGSWIAVVVSSLVFGFIHLLNPEGTILGAIYISIEAGLLLAAAYLVTRRLWIGIGVHMSWNYALSAIYSGIVSGGVADPGLMKATFVGPEILTGGKFGLESSVLVLFLCTGMGIILTIIAVRRGHVLPPPWKR